MSGEISQLESLPYFRKCRICGIEAKTIQDLEKFVIERKSKYDRDNFCKPCKSKYDSERSKEYKSRRRKINARHNEELIKYFGVPLICHFCGEKVSKLNGLESDSLVFHSLDENHDNWDPENKTPSHRGCHVRYHNSGRIVTLETRMKLRKAQLGEKHPRWQGDEASAKTKRLREYRAQKRRES